MTAYVIALFTGAGINGGLAAYAWLQRHLSAATTFMWYALFTALWMLATALAAVSPTTSEASFWYDRVRFISMPTVPVLFLIFALDIGNHRRWLKRHIIAGLLTVPAITEVVVWGGLDDIFIVERNFERVGGYLVSQSYTGGWWLWVMLVHSYAVGMLGGAVLLSTLRRDRKRFRSPRRALYIGAVLALGAAVMSTFQLTALHLDWTALAFAFIGVLWAWAIVDVGVFDVVPMAYRAVFTSIGDPVFVLNNEGSLVTMNPAAEAIMGCTVAQARGRRINELLPSDNINAEAAETLLLHGTTERYFDLRVSRLQSRGHLTAGRLLVLHDVTRRKQDAIAREHLIEELDAYAHTVAHDLKNPLAVVLGYVNLLQRSFDELTEAERQTSLTTMDTVLNKMRTIIDELLLLASVHRSEDVPRGALDMQAIVAGALAQLATIIDDRGAQVITPPFLPSALGYAPWVEAVWVNYLSNALKYGGDPPRIELGGQANEHHVRFWVRDNGDGLSLEAQARLFTPFTRLEMVRVQGDGLGLSIVQRIVERLGGEVGVESQPGLGSTFYFTLPLQV